MLRIVGCIFGLSVSGLVLLAASAQAPITSGSGTATLVNFAADVLPVLEKSCFGCHGAEIQLGDLDLTTREGALRGGAHGAALVPGNSERSKLYRMVAGLEGPAMPMSGDPLAKHQIAALKEWIDQGARWDVPVTFANDIRPIMERSCWTCHGGTMQLSKLDLRSREAALRGGAHGPALVPGNAEQSRIFRAVAHLDAIKMPMQGDRLKDEEIAAIKTWINQGAPWDTAPPRTSKAPAVNALASLETMEITSEQRNYWAFKLPVQVPLPVVKDEDLTNPIDRLLEKERVLHNLTPAPRADKRTLIRRAYLDLLGLPPTPAQVEQFIADDSPTSWSRLIDRLLTSPHYGERYGRHWLDVARYADSNGYEDDNMRPNAWRYRDYVVNSLNQDKPYNVFVKEQLAGDEIDWKTEESLIATGFLRAGPRVLFREKDNPERRFDYLDDVIATVSRGMLGLTVNCARCHNHKFDPISQKDYYALQASLFGYVETDVPLAPRAEAEAYVQNNKKIDESQRPLREAVTMLEEPHRKRLQLERVMERFPENVRRAFAKAESQRTTGEKLLVTQVLSAVNIRSEEIDQILPSTDAAGKQRLLAEIEALEDIRPKPLPMAEIVTDGDYRFAPLGHGDEVVSCQKCRIGPDHPGSFLHTGPGKYVPPPSFFLIRGDPNSRGSLMAPGFVAVATVGTPPTEIPPSDGRTSGRRRALGEWIGSAQNPLTARVIVNRVWHHHFGRGIVATLDNFGKMGDAPTHPELLDWIAVEFMNRGWSLKQLHRLVMTSDAYQMSSEFDNATNTKNDPENRYLWRFHPRRLEAEIVRDSMLAVSGNIDLSIGGRPVFPHVPEDILKTQAHGKWENPHDSATVRRRSVYVYQRRSLPFPMFETFDHPDMNVSAGARNVSTVPTQALTLLNNPFVLLQADTLAERVAREAPGDLAAQIGLAYQYALARPPTDTERSIALDMLEENSLADLTHVLLNLSEFLYLR
jgi:hypothetical protein